MFVLVTGVGAYEPSDTKRYDESSPTTGTDFFSRLLVEWEKAASVNPPVRLVSLHHTTKLHASFFTRTSAPYKLFHLSSKN